MSLVYPFHPEHNGLSQLGKLKHMYVMTVQLKVNNFGYIQNLFIAFLSI